jgi:hypothetical protein
MHGGQQKRLATPFASPNKVVAKGLKTFPILVGQRQEIISMEPLKAHIGPSPGKGRFLRPPSQQGGLSYNPSCDNFNCRLGSNL